MTNSGAEQHILLLRSFRDIWLSRIDKHFVPPGVFAGVLMLPLLLLIGCQQSVTEPVAIAPEDMCRYCKMAISEKRYAAEFMDRDGLAFKFDDIGCMVNFIKRQQDNNQIAAYFVMDFDERQWIKGADAYLVRSSEFKTPMGGSIAAFKDEAKAEVAAGKYHGSLLRFADLFNP